MTGFKVTPRPKPLVDPGTLAAFAAGADAQPDSAVQDATPQVVKAPAKAKEAKELDDKRRIPAFVLRLTERELAGLKHIAETTPHSMHEFCLNAVRKALNLNIK